MKPVEIDGIKVEISEGCGGVWFDNYELKKFDEAEEGAGAELVALWSSTNTQHADFGQPAQQGMTRSAG